MWCVRQFHTPKRIPKPQVPGIGSNFLSPPHLIVSPQSVSDPPSTKDTATASHGYRSDFLSQIQYIVRFPGSHPLVAVLVRVLIHLFGVNDCGVVELKSRLLQRDRAIRVICPWQLGIDYLEEREHSFRRCNSTTTQLASYFDAKRLSDGMAGNAGKGLFGCGFVAILTCCGFIGLIGTLESQRATNNSTQASTSTAASSQRGTAKVTPESKKPPKSRIDIEAEAIFAKENADYDSMLAKWQQAKDASPNIASQIQQAKSTLASLRSSPPERPVFSARDWKAVGTDYQTNAILVTTDGVSVKLRKTKGGVVDVEKSRLIADDRIYVDEARKKLVAHQTLTELWEDQIKMIEEQISEDDEILALSQQPEPIAPSLATIRKQLEDEEADAIRLAQQERLASEPAPQPKQGAVTARNFALVREGMTYGQVVAILGTPDNPISAESSFMGSTAMIVSWRAEGFAGIFGGNCNVTFMNGKVMAKAQLGLQ